MGRTHTDPTFGLNLAAAVRARMTANGTTELDLHRATDIPRSTLYRRLKGQAFTANEIAAVAFALGATVAELSADAERLAAA